MLSRGDFLRPPFPRWRWEYSAKWGCGECETRNIEYRKHSSATSAETQGLTGPSHLKWNLIPTIFSLLTSRARAPLPSPSPLIPYAARRRVLAKCFMQFYGKPSMYLSMRNQPLHFIPLSTNRRILSNFYKPFYSEEVPVHVTFCRITGRTM